MQQTLNRVAENLYRSQETSIYYAIFHKDGKQVKRSLKTADPELAKRKLKDTVEQVDRLDVNKSKATFAELLTDWRATAFVAKDIKTTTRSDIEGRIKRILEFWSDLSNTRCGDIVTKDVQKWIGNRKPVISAQRMNNELGILKEILDFGMDNGYMMDNPAKSIPWLFVPRTKATPPTVEQFAKLVMQLRADRCGNAADFVELLAYSGMREGECANLLWSDIDFEAETFAVTGGEHGTKNGLTRVVPLFPQMVELLRRIQNTRRTVEPSDKVMKIAQCWGTMKQACIDAGLPHFHHHDMRHFFCSNAIERGIDYMTIADWLGHQDGGQLVAETYGHLRKSHSHDMAKRMSFTFAAAVA